MSKYNIAIVGNFQLGKSTFINTLLGRTKKNYITLPGRGSKPTTKNITEIIYSDVDVINKTPDNEDIIRCSVKYPSNIKKT